MELRSPIRRALQAAALAAALALLGPAALAQAPDAPEAEAARPEAVFPTFVHDFGEVGRGDRLRHSFVVRNEGDAPLEVQSVRPT